MDKEKKERGVTVTGGGASELGAQTETTEGTEAGKVEDGKEGEKRAKATKKGTKAGKKQ